MEGESLTLMFFKYGVSAANCWKSFLLQEWNKSFHKIKGGGLKFDSFVCKINLPWMQCINEQYVFSDKLIQVNESIYELTC